MTNLYLIEQGSVVRKTGRRLIVEKNKEELLEIESFKVNTIFLFGNIHVTTPALTQILANDIELALLTRSGRLKGQVTPPFTKNVILRLAQYAQSQDPDICLKLAQIIVEGKVANSRRCLQRYQRNRPDAELDMHVVKLAEDIVKVKKAASLDSLLGYEGDSARTYFAGLAKACTSELKFTGRKRRPPPDPVNALLSLGYTLVTAEIMSLLDAAGFDPYLGVYHQTRYGRASLALDLMEEFRPDAVDRLALGLVNRRILTGKHFDHGAGDKGVRLTREGMTLFFRAYEKHLTREIDGMGPSRKTTLRKAFRRQVERLAKALVEGADYVAFQQK